MIDNYTYRKTSNIIQRSIKNEMIKYILNNRTFLLSELAEYSGFSVTTINKYVTEMLNKGQLIRLGKEQRNSKGRQSIRYGINPGAVYFVGVDIKTFELSIGLMDLTGDIIATEIDSSFNFSNTHETLGYICQKVQTFIDNQEHIDKEKIVNICMNITGRVNAKQGTSASIFNFEEMEETSLADTLTEIIGKKVYIENDTKSMAYGEYVLHLAHKYKNVLFINIGWGIGIGIIINGKLYYGMDGYAGEFGHVHYFENNVLCHCGKKGCIETEISGRAIARKLTERIADGENSLLSKQVKEGKPITIWNIIEAYEKEDALVLELLEQTGKKLGHQLAGLINIFNPEAIIIGGAISETEQSTFIQSVELAMRKYSLRLMNQKVELSKSVLGRKAGLVGACHIARARVFEEYAI